MDHGRRAPGAAILNRPQNSTIEWARSPATTKRAKVRGILQQLVDTELRSGDAIPSERACLVFGSEGPGLSRELAALCQPLVAITQYGSTRSLNAGAAAAIAMYHWALRWGS